MTFWAVFSRASWPVQNEISQQLGYWMDCHEIWYIHAPQRINPNDLSDPLNFPLTHHDVGICCFEGKMLTAIAMMQYRRSFLPNPR